MWDNLYPVVQDAYDPMNSIDNTNTLGHGDEMLEENEMNNGGDDASTTKDSQSNKSHK